MNILFVSSELYPLIKTGGLADVAYNLPKALKGLKQSLRVVLPAYQTVLEKLESRQVRASLQYRGKTVNIIETEIKPSNLKLWLVDCSDYFNRPGMPYSNSEGEDWADNAQRFSLFCEIAFLLGSDQLGLKWAADIIHCNDWQSGLIPVYCKLSNIKKKPKTVFTIHNLAYQGLFPYHTFQSLGLAQELWSYTALEYYGQLSFIKGGLVYADKLTTVSPQYAEEILQPELGCGLDGLLRYRKRDLLGIINGIDTSEWNPARDNLLSASYSSQSLDGKKANKIALQAMSSLSPTVAAYRQEPLLIAMVTRLSEQKGIDLVIDSLIEMMSLPLQLVLLGSGDKTYEKQLQQYALRYPEQLYIKLGYDEAFAHQLIAAADVFLMPSRYEPCGLTQLYSLRYGTVPLVHQVGGLADTVTDTNQASIEANTANGFSYIGNNSAALLATIERALVCFENKPLWRQLQLRGMQQDFSWTKSAKQYLHLYKSLL